MPLILQVSFISITAFLCVMLATTIGSLIFASEAKNGQLKPKVPASAKFVAVIISTIVAFIWAFQIQDRDDQTTALLAAWLFNLTLHLLIKNK